MVNRVFSITSEEQKARELTYATVDGRYQAEGAFLPSDNLIHLDVQLTYYLVDLEQGKIKACKYNVLLDKPHISFPPEFYVHFLYLVYDWTFT